MDAPGTAPFEAIMRSFAVAPREAVEIQRRLRPRVVAVDAVDVAGVDLVAGFDLAYERARRRVVVCGCLYSLARARPLRCWTVEQPVSFPYVPGLLAFREGPGIVACYAAMVEEGYEPDVLLVDGHGLAHPRGFGVASHVGVLLEKPTVGVAKSVLVGTYDEPATARGSVAWLRDRAGVVIGAAVRTRARVKPVFVSVGHAVSLESAVALTLRLSRFRVPEPLRLAHIEAERGKRGQ